MTDHRAVAADVRALVADLLPVLAPHALLDGESGLLVLPVGTAHARVALDGLVAACAGLPQHAWPGTFQAWLAATATQVGAALRERAYALLLGVPVSERLPERTAVRGELARSLPLRSERFGFEPEITARLARANARIFEVPVAYSGRTYLEGKKITWRDGFVALWVLLKYRFTE